MNKKSIFIGAIAVVIVVAVGIALRMYFKPHKDFAASTPDIVTTVREMLQTFDKDETAANKLYVAEDKTIQVNGTIKDISTETKGETVITLGDMGTDGTVSCTMMPDQAARISTLKPGQSINIKGQCTGIQTLLDKQVIMIRCALAE